MSTIPIRTMLTVMVLGCPASLCGQQLQPVTTATTVPRLVRFSSSFRAANGLPAAMVEGVTLSVYSQERDGTALWQETQNVTLDAEGPYTVLLGSTQAGGLPADLFSSGEPRWLGVEFHRSGETEQPRVLLVSVPYALKASDADTLGGRPASAYLLSPEAATAEKGELAGESSPKAVKAEQPHPQVTAGTAGSIAKFTNTTIWATPS